MKKPQMKQGFSLISAIVFITVVALMSAKLFISSKESHNLLNSEYMHAQAKAVVNATAHHALFEWLTFGENPYHPSGICDDLPSVGEKTCGSIRPAAERIDLADKETISANGDKIELDLDAQIPQNIWQNPLANSYVVDSFCLDITSSASSNKVECSAPYDLKVVIARMIQHLPASSRVKDSTFARDVSSADFQICASTVGGNVDDIAPAAYCKQFTFSN